MPFPLAFPQHFPSSHSQRSSALSQHLTPWPSLQTDGTGDGEGHFSSYCSCQGNGWEISTPRSLCYCSRVSADLGIYHCFGYTWLRLGISFSHFLRTFLFLLLKRALLLQPLSLMTRPDGLNDLTQSPFYLSHLLFFSMLLFFFSSFPHVPPTQPKPRRLQFWEVFLSTQCSRTGFKIKPDEQTCP